jgi:hypothetical protein
MKTHPRDLIAWMLAAAIVVVAAVEFMPGAHAQMHEHLAATAKSAPPAG